MPNSSICPIDMMLLKMTDFISNNLIIYDIPDVMPSQENRAVSFEID